MEEGKSVSRRNVLKQSGVIVGGLALGGTALAGSAVADGPPVRITQDLTGQTFSNPCTGEIYQITRGRSQDMFHSTGDEAGGFHIRSLSTINAVAVNQTTSEKAILNQKRTDTLNVRPPFPRTENVVTHEIIVSQGPDDNFVLKTLNQYTINAQGEPTVTKVKFESECRG